MNVIYISIAGFTIKVVFEQTVNANEKNRLKTEIESFFKNFITDLDKLFDVEIKIVDLPNPVDENIQILNGRKRYVYFYKNVTKSKIETYYQVSLFQFQIIVQNVFYHLLSRHQGFLLHASAIKVAKNAYLFCGKSGSGKSTTVRLLRDTYTTLSDDFSIIRRLNEKYYFFQHPFPEKNQISGKSKEGFEVDKIFFLDKAPYFKVVNLKNKPSTIKTFIKQIISPNQESISNAMQFGSYFKEFYKLNFTRDSEGLVNILNLHSEN